MRTDGAGSVPVERPSGASRQGPRGTLSARLKRCEHGTVDPGVGSEFPRAFAPKCTMKMITAVVRPFKLEELRQAIAWLGVQGVTVTEVQEVQFGPRVKLEIAVDDPVLEPVLEALANVARTGRSGDGRILVGPLEQAIRIRTGETGPSAA